MKVAFILSGLPDGLHCLDSNREKVATKLRENGWDVRAATFASLQMLQTYISEFKGRDIEDFIFFYTGHGDTSNEDNLLTLKLHDGSPIDLNTLQISYFSQLKIERKAIVLDACYSANYTDWKFRDGTEYLCSSDFDEQSYEDNSEGGLQHSYFSYYFCEALDNLSGEITFDSINEYIKPKIGVQNSKYISIASKMIITDKEYQKHQGILREPSKFMIDYLNDKNITKETLLKTAQKFLDSNLLSSIAKYETIDQMIIHILENEKSYCIFSDLFENDNDQIQNWLDPYPELPCQENEIPPNPVLYIIFKRDLSKDGKKYIVTFRAKDLPHKNDCNESEIYDLCEESPDKSILIQKIIEYTENDKCQINLNIVLSTELMNEDIKSWKFDRKKVGRYSDINIRNLSRYEIGENGMHNQLIDLWNHNINGYMELNIGDILYQIDESVQIDDLHNGMNYRGIVSTTVLNEDDMKLIFDLLNFRFIMLWKTKAEDTCNLAWINQKRLIDLFSEYCSRDDYLSSSLNLMWDDPTTYYYPDEI